MDTRVIEIVISLALIFALASLLVSAMQEAYSSLFGLRGKVLHQALVSFLGDDESFARALLEHPLLVSLSPQPGHMPSYANADTVVAALIAHLVEKHAEGRRPTTPSELLDLMKARPVGTPSAHATPPQAETTVALPSDQLLRGLSALAMGAGHDWPTFEARLAAWYDSVGERATGWFKRKTQLGVFFLGLGVAAALNINPIVIASRLWADEPLRQAVVTAANEASKAYALAHASAKDQAQPATAETPSAQRWEQVCSLADGGKPEPALAQLCGTLQDLGSMRQMGVPMGWTQTAWPRLLSRSGEPSVWDKVLLAPLGWLIMGLACTLGAPFWFDALGRLVRLRGSGGQSTPAMASDSASAAPAQPVIAGRGMLLQAPSPPPAQNATAPHEHDDDCAAGGHAEDATDDAELPPSRGGVSSDRGSS